MKNLFLSFTFLLLTVFSAQAAQKKLVLKSPDGSLSIESSLNSKGSMIYEVKKNNQVVISSSQMGIKGDWDFSTDLKIKCVSKAKLITETYNAPGEKRATRTYTVNSASIKLQNSAKKSLTIEFKVSNEGVAFRYIANSKKPIAITSEQTSFKFATSSRAWLHPHADAETGWAETQPSYEEQYEYDMPVGTPAPMKAGWSFPALFKTDNNWVLITEAGLTPDYVGTRLAQQSPNGEYRIDFPQKGETVRDEDPNFVVSAQVESPWRVIVVGSLATIVESQLVSDLALPADKKIDYSWVKTGVSSWSWAVLGDDATVYPVQKQFIDYASEMKWDYCLIDADWDWKIGYDKIKELADYAKNKNVGVLLWYNSSGAWNSTKYTPKGAIIQREQRRAEFKRIHEMGIAGVKVDFWPGDGQSSIQYYYDLLQDAAEYRLLVNFHGTTVPRGWSRTFPNLIALESIRGFEFTTFDQKDTDLAPKHLTMMPFARNVVGPMDFTPVCFGEIRGKQRRTSNAFEIALTVILQSGVQHFVEIPESMAKQPDYVKSYMQNIPRSWDDVKLLDGFPGKFVVIARKSSGKWYLAGINSQQTNQKVSIDLSALKLNENVIGNQPISMITDGDTNRSFSKQQLDISNNKLEVEIKANGGFVVIL
jgi:alpha-glucosidase